MKRNLVEEIETIDWVVSEHKRDISRLKVKIKMVGVQIEKFLLDIKEHERHMELLRKKRGLLNETIPPFLRRYMLGLKKGVLK